MIQAKKETAGTKLFTSGKMTTQDKMSVRYGLIEVRLKTPDIKTGLWPAAWLLGTNLPTVAWPKCGEMDMMEMGHAAAERARQGFASADINNFVGSNLIWYSADACSGTNTSCAASIAYDVNYDKPLCIGYRTEQTVLPFTGCTGMINPFVFTVEDNGNEVDLYTNPFPHRSGTNGF